MSSPRTFAGFGRDTSQRHEQTSVEESKEWKEEKERDMTKWERRPSDRNSRLYAAVFNLSLAACISNALVLFMWMFCFTHSLMWTVVKLLKSRWWNSTFPPLPSLPFSFLPLLSLAFFSPPTLLLEVGPLIQLGGLGERCKLPQRGLGNSPNRNWIWCT